MTDKPETPCPTCGGPVRVEREAKKKIDRFNKWVADAMAKAVGENLAKALAENKAWDKIIAETEKNLKPSAQP